jgi:uncharacterized Zn-finger protein
MKSDIHSGTERGEELNVQIIPEDKKKKIVCPYCKLGFFYNSDKQAKCPGCSRVIV